MKTANSEAICAIRDAFARAKAGCKKSALCKLKFMKTTNPSHNQIKKEQQIVERECRRRNMYEMKSKVALFMDVMGNYESSRS